MNIRELNLEYKLGAGMGALAMVISLLLGASAGNSIGQVFFMSFTLAIVFIGVGYGSAFVLKRYVPEVYDLLNTTTRKQPEEQKDEMHEVKMGAAGPGGAVEGTAAEEPVAGEKAGVPDTDGMAEAVLKEPVAETFVPLKDSGIKKFTTARGEEGKLGKHLFEEKKIKYEPKIMAEAIRTMMIRDK